MDDELPTRRWVSHFGIALLLIMLVAAGLRLYRLPELPLGFHYDEAANGILAGEIARGIKTPVFIPAYTGKEVLFFYWAALWMKLLGVTPLALRLSAALAGLATVAATTWAAYELFHEIDDAKWVALLTGAFLATSFWHLILSRYGFRAVTQPLMQALTIAALWRGLRLLGKDQNGPKGLLWLILAGLLCGLTAYTYLAARAFPIPLAAAMLALLLSTGPSQRGARLGQLILFVVVAALALAPLAHYWITHPDSFLTRTQQVAATSWSEVQAGIVACLKMFFIRGDPYIRFNIPYRPLFDPITAVLFLLGIIVLLTPRLLSTQHPIPDTQRPASNRLFLASRVFLLTHIPVMLLPSALAVGEVTPSNLRAAGLLPFIYLLPALGLCAIISQIKNHRSKTALHLLPSIVYTLLSILLLVALTPTTATTYFRTWASSAALYDAADGDLVDIATYLNQTELAATTPYVASKHYRHPTLGFLAEEYGAIRWITAGKAVVFPAEGDGLLLFSRSAFSDLNWVESVIGSDSLLAHVPPLGPDGAPAFRAYRVRSDSNRGPARSVTANLADVIHLLGYDVVGEPCSGGRARVAIWWQVLNLPHEGDFAPLTRLTDPWGFVWGEARSFHYPSEQWTPGEWVVDYLSLPVAAGTPPGDYEVHFGLYSASADTLLPVLDDTGQYAGTNVRLPLYVARGSSSPALEDLSIRTRLDTSVEGLTLLGFNLDTTDLRPGERIYVTLFWQTHESPLHDRDVTLALGDTPISTGAPVHNTYPISSWSAGEVVIDRYDPRLPRHWPFGDYLLRLCLSRSTADSGDDLALTLGEITVTTIDRAFETPLISHPLTATLDDQVRLLGYDLSGDTFMPGDVLTLTLYWQAQTEMDKDYTVFAHLLAADGSITGQRDNHPVGGTYPTSLWLTDEVVTDVYEIHIRADAAPGDHWLKVGMYIAESGYRLPTGAPDDAIALQTITVTDPQAQ
jgi:4-amino-4-deoxy-L-arabinose transferase-like glycosyltransferase